MANILQVTTPNINTDNRNILNPQDPRGNAANQAVHNPTDPTRVVRADGQQEGHTGSNTQDALFAPINYESNYGAFIKGLGESGQLAAILENILFTDVTKARDVKQNEVGSLVEKLLLSMKMESPEEIVDFFQSQQEVQAKFTGPFFNQLRSILAQNSSNRLQELALRFLKGYNDFSSGAHLLQQMRSLTSDIEQLLYRAYREEFHGMLEEMNWTAENGDTQQNTAVINNRLIPFLASYISATHDYGPIREATMLLIFHAVRYQNGGEEKLLKLFDEMTTNKGFTRLFKGDVDESLKELLHVASRQVQRPTEGISTWLIANKEDFPQAQNKSAISDFADGMANLMLKGANGQAGLENVQQFYSMINGMLLNESVYLPLLHFVIPFQYEDNNVMSEMWVDPDAKRDNDDRGRKIKLFLKFDIQGLGKFELLMIMQDRETRLQLMVPPQLAKDEKKIHTEVADILKRNGFRFSQLLVRERVRDRRVDEVFPEIREKERTINVRI